MKIGLSPTHYSESNITESNKASINYLTLTRMVLDGTYLDFYWKA